MLVLVLVWGATCPVCATLALPWLIFDAVLVLVLVLVWGATRLVCVTLALPWLIFNAVLVLVLVWGVTCPVCTTLALPAWEILSRTWKIFHLALEISTM